MNRFAQPCGNKTAYKGFIYRKKTGGGEGEKAFFAIFHFEASNPFPPLFIERG
jgi:hypothetical protein